MALASRPAKSKLELFGFPRASVAYRDGNVLWHRTIPELFVSRAPRTWGCSSLFNKYGKTFLFLITVLATNLICPKGFLSSETPSVHDKKLTTSREIMPTPMVTRTTLAAPVLLIAFTMTYISF